MWSYIAGGVLLVLVIYFIVQGIRCNMAVKESKSRLATYNAQTIALSYGDMTYVDSGKGEVILSVHGIFGGYDQAYDTCKDFCSDYPDHRSLTVRIPGKRRFRRRNARQAGGGLCGAAGQAGH